MTLFRYSKIYINVYLSVIYNNFIGMSIPIDGSYINYITKDSYYFHEVSTTLLFPRLRLVNKFFHISSSGPAHILLNTPIPNIQFFFFVPDNSYFFIYMGCICSWQVTSQTGSHVRGSILWLAILM